MSEILFDNTGRHAREVYSDASFGIPEERMPDEVVENRKRNPTGSVDADDTYLPVNGADRFHLLVGWAGIGMTDTPLLPVLQSEPVVEGNAILVTHSSPEGPFGLLRLRLMHNPLHRRPS